MAYEHKMEKEMRCPLKCGLEIFGGKWKSRIVCVLASMLKEMGNDGVLARKQYDEIPPRVEYSLTEKGKTVLPILQSICLWSKKNSRTPIENVLSACQTCGQL